MASSDLAYVDGGLLDYEPSLFSHFHQSLQSFARETAIIVAHQNADHLETLVKPLGTQPIANGHTNGPLNWLSWTYEQLHHAAAQVVNNLRLRGVGAGSTVVVLVPNGIEWAIFLWASVLGKFSLSNLDFGALSKPRAPELEMLLRKLKPDVIAVIDKAGAHAMDIALESQDHIPKVKVMMQSRDIQQNPIEAGDSASGWSTLLSLADPKISEPAIKNIEQEALFDDQARVAFILFTSGTTAGTPKGCPHTVRETLHNITQDFGPVSSQRPRRLLQTANFRIISPTMTMATWSQGGAVILPSASFNAQAMLAALRSEDFAISMCFFVPAQLHATVAQDDFAAASEQISKQGTLRTIFLGADIVTEDLYNKACRAFPNVEVRIGHGMTEGGSAFAWPAGVKSLPYYAGIAPLGQTNRGTRLKIAAAQSANEQGHRTPLKRGETGELHLWSEGILRGYLDGVNVKDFYTDGDGNRWFCTGDMGMMNRDGWVYILGREKDIVKRAGVPITPAAIESSLDTFLRSQTSVVGVPHPILGQAPCAVVKSLGSNTKEAVKKHVLEIFGPDYALGDVLTLEELALEDFPVNATGKILKRELLDRIR